MDVVAESVHWTELGDFLDGAAIISCSGEESPNCREISRPYATFENGVFKGFQVRADTPITTEPDLLVGGFDFKIWEDAYFFYPGPFFTGSFDPASVRIAYVPEPASWALMIAGFGLTGAALRRRKVRTVTIPAS